MFTTKKTYWFILGNFPKISAAEIMAVLSLPAKSTSEQNGILKTAAKPIDAGKLISQIGGTIKIGEELSTGLTKEKLIAHAAETLSESKGKINFGISFYGEDRPYLIKKWAKEIKEILKKQGRNARFVFKNSATLSSVTVEKNRLTKKGAEFLITRGADGFAMARTLSVQPFEALGERDYGRPGRDDKSGMLPPKLALMLINLSGSDKKNILDPFCGSGTILSEATLLGYHKIIGSDSSGRAIADTIKNLNWLREKTKQKSIMDIFPAQVQELPVKIKPHSLTTIVTEPYLGRPLRGQEDEYFLKRQAEELKKIYLSAFVSFAKILKKGGVVVFIIPRFKLKNGWITISCQKEIEALGFVPEPLGPEKFLLYHRSKQRVGREIWKFVKK